MIRESSFYRGRFSSRRFAHFYENDTFSSGKRVIFLRRIMTGGHFFTSKIDSRSLFCGGHYSSLHRLKFAKWRQETTYILGVQYNHLLTLYSNCRTRNKDGHSILCDNTSVLNYIKNNTDMAWKACINDILKFLTFSSNKNCWNEKESLQYLSRVSHFCPVSHQHNV